MAKVGRLIPGAFVTGGNPDTVNDTFPSVTSVGSAYDLRGQLGAVLRANDGEREWIYAVISATGTGKALAANQVMYWWSSTSTSTTNTPYNWVVDNQTSASNSPDPSKAAGILRNAATRGSGVWLLRKSPSCAVVSTTTQQVLGVAVVATTASGEATTIGSTSTAFPAGGQILTPMFQGAVRLGWVNSTSTAYVNSTTTAGVGVNIDCRLDIE